MALPVGAYALQSKSNKKYLRYVSEKEKPRFRYVEFSEKSVGSPNIKFQVEKASSGNDTYVHIRSSYNNKYLRRLDDSQQYWIVAGADEKEEDKSKWSCTLFEPIVVDHDDNNNMIRIRHVQLGNYTQVYTRSGDFQGCMIANSKTPVPIENGDDVYTFTKWASVVVLPKYVAFKGDNGKYLCRNPTGEDNLLFFKSSDIGEDGVAHQIFPENDGRVSIRAYGKEVGTWEAIPIRFEDYYLIQTALGSETAGDGTGMSLFQPIMAGDSVIFLKISTTPPAYCARAADNDLLFAYFPTYTEREKLTVVEPVMKRTISLTFRLEDARVYDMTPVTLDTFEHDNKDTAKMTKTVTLHYKKEVTTSWETGNTWNVGAKASITVDAIPFVANASVEFSAEYGGSYTMGATTTTSEEMTEADSYDVRGRHKLVVQKLAYKGHCDVPFSYNQTDHLFNGDIITTVKADGLYKGVNCFHIKTVSDMKPLPSTSISP